ncbi:hypothetical protein SERLA73DRAFT_80810 [Serpula lacrymans var. lacrymans S7.3]|uniref:Uncharacterized protein n=1 Tax=Serpula lacrymans var. lacrymans (strain S7.3) TaxID=936435 RepID=F8QKB1_SERL3|nr:hypothetical protein SERLA73DRAFT_80810 [Serpula lacrymans var. lacrymans S7.3]
MREATLGAACGILPRLEGQQYSTELAVDPERIPNLCSCPCCAQISHVGAAAAA